MIPFHARLKVGLVTYGMKENEGCFGRWAFRSGVRSAEGKDDSVRKVSFMVIYSDGSNTDDTQRTVATVLLATSDTPRRCLRSRDDWDTLLRCHYEPALDETDHCILIKMHRLPKENSRTPGSKM